MTDFNDGQWHGWNGGDCPVHPKSMVEAVCMSGTPWSPYSAGSVVREAGVLGWMAPITKIVAFRVTKVHREPREWDAVRFSPGEMFTLHQVDGIVSALKGTALRQPYEKIRVREVLE